MKVVHLQVARVVSHDNDNLAIIERTIVKLMEGANFDKFVKYMPLKSYIGKETKVLKVFENDKECSIDEFELKVRNALDKKVQLNTDLKVELEKERKRNDELEMRLNRLEANTPKEPAPSKSLANETEVEIYERLFGEKPHHNMKLETIKLKIEEKLNN